MRDGNLLDMRPGNYISRVWFFSKPDAKFDVLMVLKRELPDGLWQFEYRFRYYEDENAFDSEDEKRAWYAEFPTMKPEAQVIRELSPVIEMIEATTRLDMDVVIIESDEPLVAIELLKRKKWFNFKVVKVPD